MYIVLIIVGVVLVLLVMILATNYNRFVRLNNKVLESFSDMDAYLKKRIDLIPNLVEVCKGYMTHEKSLLEEIVNLRNKKYSSMSLDEKIEHNNEISSKITNLLAVSENYPDLKSNQNFLNLSSNLKEIETEIAHSRLGYNNIVTTFNTTVLTFPNNVFAKMFGFKKKELFVASEEERKNVKVKF